MNKNYVKEKIIIIFFIILSFQGNLIQELEFDLMTVESDIFFPQQNQSDNPIEIIGNTELINFIDKSGSGTIEDPYIIENFFIELQNSDSGIFIQDTSMYLVIRNFSVRNISFSEEEDIAGIKLANCSNIRIEYSKITLNYIGILIIDSSNITLFENNVSNNEFSGISLSESENITIFNTEISQNTGYGLYVYKSNNNFFHENNASFNIWNGIYLSQSNLNIISNNFFSNNINDGIRLSVSHSNFLSENSASYNGLSGLTLYDSNGNYISDNAFVYNGEATLQFSNAHNNLLSNNTIIGDGIRLQGSYNNQIDPTNYVNGKPILQYKDLEGFVLNGSLDPVGQLFLINCSNFEITDIEFSNIITPVTIENCTNAFVSNILTNNSEVGMGLFDSINITVSNSEFYNNLFNGILISTSDGILIKNNSVTYGSFGISGGESQNIVIMNNSVSYFGLTGVGLYSSINSSITGNIISKFGSEYEEGNGISLSSSHQNNISENEISYCLTGLILEFSDNNFISYNSIKFNLQRAVFLFSSDNNSLLYNTISYNFDSGISLFKSDHNEMINNYIFFNNNNNISVESGEFNTFDNEYRERNAPIAPVLNVIPLFPENGTYSIEWSESPGTLKYILMRSTDGEFLTEIFNPIYEGDNSSFIDVVPESEYYFYLVIAFNSSGFSEFSNIFYISANFKPVTNSDPTNYAGFIVVSMWVGLILATSAVASAIIYIFKDRRKIKN